MLRSVIAYAVGVVQTKLHSEIPAILFLSFIYDLFSDPVTTSQYAASNYGMINKLGRLWKKEVAVVVSSEVL
jgi:hypothetical protein